MLKQNRRQLKLQAAVARYTPNGISHRTPELSSIYGELKGLHPVT